ncbi:hypothetical protein DL93DRAFT_2079626 [Clavulina sp. PMI_390]|nr:hypothetical protein DL93DRAFT_2079626 [Clavulina sp. PMI_390]
METKDQPGGARAQQHASASSSNSSSVPPSRTPQYQGSQNPASNDQRMRSLLAASMAVSPPSGYNISSARTVSQDQTPVNQALDKGKRKRDEDGLVDESSQDAIRRRTGEVPRPRPGDIPPSAMTHVTCLHAAVAQKSYGHEKRFLCPPPLVRVHTPMHSIKDQKFTMSVVTEDGIRLADQVSMMDSIMQFKYLHVGGASSKSKSFHLTLDIAAPDLPSPQNPTPASSTRRWASFESGAVTIISKPSKKTAKTRNISTCIMNGSSVSLFNRINSQTVRTKYMTVDRAELAASNMSWSAFRIQILDDETGNPISPVGNQPSDTPRVGGMNLAGGITATPTVIPTHNRPIQYGARVVLTDEATGISSEPLIIRKVDKGKLQKPEPNGGSGLVSQMQKIALQRASSNSDVPDVPAGLYLSAGRLPLPVHSSDRSAVATSHSQSIGDGKTVSTAHPLTYQAPRAAGNVTNADEVDDFLCWTIVGIAEYQYTFFDASTVHSPLSVPPTPVTPFPIAVLPPQYQISSHRLDMQVLHFFPTDPRTGTPMGMEVWIGNLGPLPVHTVIPPTAPPNGMFNLAGPNGFMTAPPQLSPTVEAGFVKLSQPGAGPSNTLDLNTPTTEEGENPPLPGSGRHTSLDPPGTRRTTDPVMIISVEMPPMAQVLKAIHDLTTPPAGSPSGANSGTAPQSGQSTNGNTTPVPGSSTVAAPGGAANNGQAGGYFAPPPPPAPQGFPGQANGAGGMPGRAALPIIFVRPFDLVGYMTGYSIACENVFSGNGLADPGLGSTSGWTLRVV